jgi:hypothetical protein
VVFPSLSFLRAGSVAGCGFGGVGFHGGAAVERNGFCTGRNIIFGGRYDIRLFIENELPLLRLSFGDFFHRPFLQSALDLRAPESPAAMPQHDHR